jgi:hypothetical protein
MQFCFSVSYQLSFAVTCLCPVLAPLDIILPAFLHPCILHPLIQVISFPTLPLLLTMALFHLGRPRTPRRLSCNLAAQVPKESDFADRRSMTAYLFALERPSALRQPLHVRLKGDDYKIRPDLNLQVVRR